MGLLQKARRNTTTLNQVSELPSQGFLERAKSFRTSNEIEQLCMDRLRRLEQGAPYAALTILKTYYPAIAGLVFKKTDGGYRMTASVGISEQACSEENIQFSVKSPDSAHDEYSVLPAEDLRLTCLPLDAAAMAFPFDGIRSGYVVFVTDETPFASASSIARIVRSFPDKFVAEHGSINRSDGNDAAAAADRLMAAIDAFEKLGESHILQFKLKDSCAHALASLTDLARARLGVNGNAINLPPDRIVVLLKASLDRELYAHQLLKAFNGVFALKAGEVTLDRWGHAADRETVRSLLVP